MTDGKKSLHSDPFGWIFRTSLLLLGASIALNLAVAWLCPIVPWLAGAGALIAAAWAVVAIVRWRRSNF